jgi:cation:H+ antiporter
VAAFAWIALGLVLLLVGGEFVVRGAGRLALAAGLRPLVVGLTVVAFCTSAPELAASVTAAVAGSPGLAVGNVLGSNVANLGLVLGVAALIRPVAVRSTVLLRELPVMLGASLLLVLLGWDGSLSRLDGALMLGLLTLYLVLMVRAELRAKEPRVEAEVEESVGPLGSAPRNVALVVGGVAALVLGADRLVLGASALARTWGMSEDVVGLTVMAVGTSLPELAASGVAAHRGQGDIVLGNVVGSNIFNILCILGVTALVHPVAGGMLHFRRDLWVGVAFCVAVFPLMLRGRVVTRGEGGLLLGAYAAYIAWIL